MSDLPKIKNITLDVKCDNCDHVYEVTTNKIKSKYHSCDCDYPCSCFNGAYLSVNSICPKCNEKNETIICREDQHDN